MKIIKIITFFLTLSFFSFIPPENKRDIIQVHKVLGIEAYFMSEPLREYEVVTGKGSGITIGASYLTGGLVNEGVSEKATKMVKKVIKEINKKGLSIDAVIYSGGKTIIGIKFTDKSEENKGLGRVRKIDGIGVYLLGEPLLEYQVVASKGSGLKLKSLATGGLINNSIEEDVSSFVRKLKKKTKGNLDGVLYSSGSDAVAFKLK